MSYEYIKCGTNKWRACYTEFLCPGCGRPTLYSHIPSRLFHLDDDTVPRNLRCWDCAWQGPWGLGMQGAINKAKKQLDAALVKALVEAL